MSGSDALVTEAFREHREALVRYVARFTGDPDLAEDVVQETLLRLRDRPPADTSHVRGWLFTVATNLARDALKVSRRRLMLVRGAGDRLPHADPPPDPATALERAEVRRRVRLALDRLSVKERTMLLMREEGFTHREIAEAIGTTTKSVGTMLARAIDKVGRALESERL
ncbi:MAG TPA: RNA polymerase sigma factor [Gemmatimonadales bacterium]